jgi:hypothetical protein
MLYASRAVPRPHVRHQRAYQDEPLQNNSPEDRTAASPRPPSGAAAPAREAADPGVALVEGAPRTRLVRRPSTGEWVLFAYLAMVTGLTIAAELLGWPDLHVLASSPNDIASGRLWSLLSSGLAAEGWLGPQVAATAVLGVAAIRLAGGGVFWSAAIIAHVAGTLLVYAGVWIADAVTPAGAATPSGLAALASQADFGISLVWCAALGVLAGVGWWKTRPMTRLGRAVLCLLPPAALIAVTMVSDGLAFFEHIAAFALAVMVVLVDQRWGSAVRAVVLRRGSTR